MQSFDFQSHTRAIFGEGALERLGALARESGFRRTLFVADHGLVASGHVDEAIKLLRDAGIAVFPFHDFDVNPDTQMIERGRDFAAPLAVDSIIGLGGGTSLDCAKGINFLLTNGGEMKDYWGCGKATQPMLPMIGVPTTAGTGSEAQSYALISDAETRVKMACGDPQAAFRVALLDPLLTVSQPAQVTATAGYDAIAHAVETFVTTKRNPLSETFSREAWRLLEANYERVLSHPHDTKARGQMQLGAHFAGVAIENSMLGAAHACANPLTRRYGTTHGASLAALLPTIVRWNSAAVKDRYHELCALSRHGRNNSGANLARRLEELAAAGGLRVNLRSLEVPSDDLPLLAEDAATQWTGRFNPRLFDAAGALEIYERAF
ncbi:MAG: iron-containing alcohol dehydrogenase [Acidobacteriota bacterium]|nr:iron-containing alcohol dehydrogenase [Acidobacteriota bacterium]